MRIKTVWHDNYHCLASGRLLSTRKQKEVVEAALAEGLIAVADKPTFNREAAWADIATVHAPAYVAAVRTGRPRRLAESQGFNWSPEFADSVVRIWNGHQAACHLALSEGLVLHPVSGAHHARRDCGSGFCTFNYLVGAGRALLNDGTVKRVAILDLDAHAGDGTLSLVGEDDRFGLFDISSGWAFERAGYYAARTSSDYFAALAKLPEFLDAFNPELVEYQAGMDCYEGDGMGAVRGLNADRLEERDRVVLREVISRGIPTVINLAGGYLEDGTTVELHLQTIRIAGSLWEGASAGSASARVATPGARGGNEKK